MITSSLVPTLWRGFPPTQKKNKVAQTAAAAPNVTSLAPESALSPASPGTVVAMAVVVLSSGTLGKVSSIGATGCVPWMEPLVGCEDIVGTAGSKSAPRSTLTSSPTFEGALLSHVVSTSALAARPRRSRSWRLVLSSVMVVTMLLASGFCFSTAALNLSAIAFLSASVIEPTFFFLILAFNLPLNAPTTRAGSDFALSFTRHFFFIIPMSFLMRCRVLRSNFLASSSASCLATVVLAARASRLALRRQLYKFETSLFFSKPPALVHNSLRASWRRVLWCLSAFFSWDTRRPANLHTLLESFRSTWPKSVSEKSILTRSTPLAFNADGRSLYSCTIALKPAFKASNSAPQFLGLFISDIFCSSRSHKFFALAAFPSVSSSNSFSKSLLPSAVSSISAWTSDSSLTSFSSSDSGSLSGVLSRHRLIWVLSFDVASATRLTHFLPFLSSLSAICLIVSFTRAGSNGRFSGLSPGLPGSPPGARRESLPRHRTQALSLALNLPFSKHLVLQSTGNLSLPPISLQPSPTSLPWTQHLAFFLLSFSVLHASLSSSSFEVLQLLTTAGRWPHKYNAFLHTALSLISKSVRTSAQSGFFLRWLPRLSAFGFAGRSVFLAFCAIR